jgi:hypothetical protein
VIKSQLEILFFITPHIYRPITFGNRCRRPQARARARHRAAACAAWQSDDKHADADELQNPQPNIESGAGKQHPPATNAARPDRPQQR